MEKVVPSRDRHRLLFPLGTFLLNEGRRISGCCKDGRWRPEFAGQRWFSDLAGGHQVAFPVRKVRFMPSSDVRQYCGIPLKNFVYDEAWHKQSGPNVLPRAVCGFGNGDCLRKYLFFNGGFRNVHASRLRFQVESVTSQGDVPVYNGVHKSTSRTAEEFHQGVKNIVAVLSHEGWERALGEMNVHPTQAMVCEVLKRQRNVYAAFAFFEWVREQKRFQHTGRTYRVMLQKLMSQRELYFDVKAVDTFRLVMKESLQRGWSPGVTVHTYLIDKECKLGNLNAAFDHLNEMKRLECAPNVVTYSCLIGGLIRFNRLHDALGLLDEMKVQNCLPNVVTYSCLINGLVKHQRVGQACKIFEKMKEQGCIPNLITYASLIEGVTRAGKFEEILKLLDEMRQTGCIPSLFIYGTVINYFVKAGNVQKAWDLFNELKAHGLAPNLLIYTPLITSLGRAGDWARAQKLFVEMKSSGCAPDEVAYTSLIAGLMKAGKLENACLALDEMEADGCHANEVIYSMLIGGLKKDRQAEKAESLFKKMVSKGRTPTLYTQDSIQKELAKISS